MAKWKFKSDEKLGITVGLDFELTPELKAQGILRETLRQINSFRKSKNFQLG